MLLVSGLLMVFGSVEADAIKVHTEEQRVAYIKKRIRESGPKKHFNPENYSTQDYIMLGLLIFITMDGLVLYPKFFGAQ